LYLRLSGITLRIPPLRERRGEIASLARSFIPLGGPLLSPAALRALEAYAWPGNVRELRNVIERAALLASPGPIRPEDLGLETTPRTLRSSRPSVTAREAMPGSTPLLEPGERERILAALERCAGNQSLAAKELGISRRTLTNRL